MARTPSAKTLALKVAQDSSQASWTRWQAILTLEGLIPPDELELLLRQLLSATKKGRVVRLCLEKLTALEEARKHRHEVDKILQGEIERLRDPSKNNIPPEVQAPVPVIPETKPRPQIGQNDIRNILGAEPAVEREVEPAVEPTAAPKVPPVAQPTPVAVTQSTPATPAAPPGTAASTAKDPRPSWNLPKGAILERDEQARLLELFRAALDSQNDKQRKAARLQLERVIPAPDSGRSTFAVYLLAMLDWLDRHPEQKPPKALADHAPVIESNPDYELFSFNFSVNRWLQQQAEADRLRRQIERANEETKGGGMWEGLPAI